jgi:hypothetical protein
MTQRLRLLGCCVLAAARRGLALLLALALPVSVAAQSHTGRVWLAGVDVVNAADRQRLNPSAPDGNDFMDLFRPDAPWRKAAAATRIFKVSERFLDASTYDQLRAVIEDLHGRHIALGPSAQIMGETRQCGRGSPGFSSKASMQKAADRVKLMGGQIDYVAFDSPVAFGHFNILNKSDPCQYSMANLVRNIAPQIEVLKTAFPDIEFDDVEPVNTQTVGWIDAYLEFAREFRAQTGSPISSLQADIIWFDNWRPQLVVWRQRLRAAGIGYGVIFDGSGVDKSDQAWTNHAVERFQTVTHDSATAPDDYVFQSWNDYPTRFLPETGPGTLTWAVTQTVGGRQQ